MGDAGSKIGNFFISDLKSVRDAFEGFGSIIGDTFSGITSGDFDYSNTVRHYTNMGEDYRNMFTGRTDTTGKPVDPNKQKLENYNRSIDPNASWNAGNYSSMRSNASSANPAYGSAVGNPNAKPSDLMKISDPATKMAMSSSRGTTRTALNVAGNQMDTKMAPQLMSGGMASTPSSSAVPAPTAPSP